MQQLFKKNLGIEVKIHGNRLMTENKMVDYDEAKKYYHDNLQGDHHSSTELNENKKKVYNIDSYFKGKNRPKNIVFEVIISADNAEQIVAEDVTSNQFPSYQHYDEKKPNLR